MARAWPLAVEADQAESGCLQRGAQGGFELLGDDLSAHL